MNRLYFTRHGETTWNKESKTQGNTDIPLSETGISQAKKLAERFQDKKVDVIFSSDLSRAYDTAKIINTVTKADIIVSKAFKEISFGVWEGMNINDIMQTYPYEYKMWREKPEEANIPNAESLIDFKGRIEAELEKIYIEYSGKNVLIVAHGMVNKIIALKYLELDVNNIYKIKQNNTALNIVDFKSYGPVITCLNDSSHLNI